MVLFLDQGSAEEGFVGDKACTWGCKGHRCFSNFLNLCTGLFKGALLTSCSTVRSINTRKTGINMLRGGKTNDTMVEGEEIYLHDVGHEREPAHSFVFDEG